MQFFFLVVEYKRRVHPFIFSSSSSVVFFQNPLFHAIDSLWKKRKKKGNFRKLQPKATKKESGFEEQVSQYPASFREMFCQSFKLADDDTVHRMCLRVDTPTFSTKTRDTHTSIKRCLESKEQLLRNLRLFMNTLLRRSCVVVTLLSLLVFLIFKFQEKNLKGIFEGERILRLILWS